MSVERNLAVTRKWAAIWLRGNEPHRYGVKKGAFRRAQHHQIDRTASSMWCRPESLCFDAWNSQRTWVYRAHGDPL